MALLLVLLTGHAGTPHAARVHNLSAGKVRRAARGGAMGPLDLSGAGGAAACGGPGAQAAAFLCCCCCKILSASEHPGFFMYAIMPSLTSAPVRNDALRRPRHGHIAALLTRDVIMSLVSRAATSVVLHMVSYSYCFQVHAPCWEPFSAPFRLSMP